MIPNTKNQYQQESCLDSASDVSASPENTFLINEITSKMLLQTSPLSENAVWEMLAEHISHDWKLAKAALQKAENDLFILNKPENRPLGLIGRALAAEGINAVVAAHDEALTQFTIINEGLLEGAEAKSIMKSLLINAESMNEALKTVKAPETLTREFTNVSPRQPRKGLRELFAVFTKRSLRQAQPLTPKVSLT